MKKIFSEFKTFIAKGNVMDLAVGIIIGSAFTSIVNSIVNNIFMPVINTITSRVDFDALKWILVKDAEEQAKFTIDFGLVISAVLNFLITAIVVFFAVKTFNKFKDISTSVLEHKKSETDEKKPEEKECPFCMTKINIKAVRCPHCTSIIEDEDTETPPT